MSRILALWVLFPTVAFAGNFFPAEVGDRWDYDTKISIAAIGSFPARTRIIPTTVEVQAASGPWRYLDYFAVTADARWVAYVDDVLWVWDAAAHQAVALLDFRASARGQGWHAHIRDSQRYLQHISVYQLQERAIRNETSEFPSCVGFLVRGVDPTYYFEAYFAEGVGLVLRDQFRMNSRMEIASASVQRGLSSPQYRPAVEVPFSLPAPSSLGGASATAAIGSAATVVLPPPAPPQTFQPDRIAGGDLDGDGDSDLAVIATRGSQRELFVLTNDGQGGLGTPTVWGTLAPEAVLLDLADFDDDGRLDVITSPYVRGGLPRRTNLSVVRRGLPPLQLQGAVNAGHLRVADLDGDGTTDLLSVSTLINTSAGPMPPNEVVALLSNGSGPPLRVVTQISTEEVIDVDIADFNGDGAADLALTFDLGGRDEVDLFFGDGLGGFRNFGGYTFTTPVSAVALGDLYGDAVPELIAVRDWGYGQQQFDLIALDWFSSLTPRHRAPLRTSAQRLDVLDLNGDGDREAVGVSHDGFSVVAVPSASGHRWDLRHPCTYPHGGAFVDLTGNGRLDAVAINGGSISVRYAK